MSWECVLSQEKMRNAFFKDELLLKVFVFQIKQMISSFEIITFFNQFCLFPKFLQIRFYLGEDLSNNSRF